MRDGASRLRARLASSGASIRRRLRVAGSAECGSAGSRLRGFRSADGRRGVLFERASLARGTERGELLRGVRHLELAAARALEDDVLSRLHREIVTEAAVAGFPNLRRDLVRRVHVAAHQPVERLDRLLDGLLEANGLIRRRRGRLVEELAAQGEGSRSSDPMARHGGRRGRLRTAAAAGAISTIGCDDRLGRSLPPAAACPVCSTARPTRRPPPDGARSRPAGAARARRRCSGPRMSSVWSQRSASSNLSRRSLMSASAFKAMTFSPSSVEHVEERGLRGLHVAQVHVAAAQHDAGRDVVGMDLRGRGRGDRGRAEPPRSCDAPRREART